MAETRVTVIPGDGIGPDIIDATLRLLDALDCDFAYDRAIAGQTALDQGKDLVPQETLDMIEKNPVALKGPITTPVGKGFRSVNVTLRKHFDLFANLRPALSIPGVRSRYDNVDILTIREKHPVAMRAYCEDWPACLACCAVMPEDIQPPDACADAAGADSVEASTAGVWGVGDPFTGRCSKRLTRFRVSFRTATTSRRLGLCPGDFDALPLAFGSGMDQLP